MSNSSLRWVVAITTALIALDIIISHALQLPEEAWDSPAMREYRYASNYTAPGVTSYLAKNGSLVFEFPDVTDKSDTVRILGLNPKAIIIYALMVPFSQYWNIWLEKKFPARPDASRSHVANDAQDEKGSDLHLDKQNAPRTTQRSSLSKRNTLAKWLLDVLVGTVIYEFMWHASYICLMDRNLALLKTDLYNDMYSCTVDAIFSMASLIKLIALLIIPAQHRVVFEATGDLVRSTFFYGFFYLFGPYASRTQIGQSLIYILADELWKKAPQPNLFPPHYLDEL